MSSKLHYFGTDEDVRPGDRVQYTSLILRRKRLATVVCIPEKTAVELDVEKKQPEDWLIKFDDGTYTGWMYHPEELQPNKRLILVSRGAEYERITGADLDRMDNEIAENTSIKEDLLGCAAVIAIIFAVIMLIAVVVIGVP